MRTKEKDNDAILCEYNTLRMLVEGLGFVFETKVLSEEDIETYNNWNAYKAEKNFEKADELRAILIEKGII